ncbi:hypothetical protein G3545_08705 [Starkeya sp. ORNL1]|uniref:hypothetical protein n=1 Tax=Starkeya sp. ORNL1 TaxID=2709380 RepID=UPI001463D94E|nr:hypothetical protein [Starkeya sp. ORNL1]QJP13730.1 hypothetical protein G3545_08705 [Starkeya sp. ORNL1]
MMSSVAARRDVVTIDALLTALADSDLFVASRNEAMPGGPMFRPLVIQYEGIPFAMTFTAPNRPEPGAAIAWLYEDVLKVAGREFFLHLAPAIWRNGQSGLRYATDDRTARRVRSQAHAASTMGVPREDLSRILSEEIRQMSDDKPRLLPLSVPWMVATSMPSLRMQTAPDGRRRSVTFVAYFKLVDRRRSAFGEMPQIVEEAPPFELLQEPDEHPYHLVRINFVGGLYSRTTPRFSDGEVIPEDDYDWSAVQGALQPGEDTVDNVRRRRQFWLDHGISPDPGVYVVEK